MPAKTKPPKYFFTLLLIVLAFAIITPSTILINIHYVNNLTDGTENYSGEELVAAKQGLERFDNFDDGMGTYQDFAKQRVTKVVYTPWKMCNARIQEHVYTYTLETISWFGIKVDEYVGATCKI